MYHRCGLCNKVSNTDIATNPEDYHDRLAFMPDPDNTDFDLCIECYESVRENLLDLDPEYDEEDIFDEETED